MDSFNISLYTKKIVPFLLCLLLALLAQTPNIRFIFANLIFIPIYYFAIFRPSLLNAYAVFGIGIFVDLLSQTPIGLFSFIFVLLFFIAHLNHLFLKDLSFKSLWMLFSFCSGFLLLIQLFLFTLSEGSFIQTKFLFQQFLILILLFPLGLFLCNLINDWIGNEP